MNFVDPRYRVPGTVEDTKNFSFSSKPMRMSVEAPVTAFVCGQKASFLVCYNNDSSTTVAQTTVQLVRTNQYNADTPKTRVKLGNEGIKMSSFEGVPGKTAKNVEVHLVIPSVAPSSDGSCRVLIIAYEIHITAVFGGLHSDHTLKIPIVVGTVPFLSPELLTPSANNDAAPEYPSATAPLFNGASAPLFHIAPSSSSQPAPNIRSTFSRDSIGWNFGPSSSTAFIQGPSAPVPTTPEDYDMRKFLFIFFELYLN